MTSRDTAENPGGGTGWYVDLLFVVVLAAVVRVWAAQNELWLDEIWSLLAFVRGDHAPLDTFTQHHDNNHYLNTLWMFVVGAESRHWVWYRLPSIVAGVATVLLAARFALRWGRRESFLTAILAAASYVLIVYASEARGYAMAGCFALLGVLALERFIATRGWRANLLYALATVLALLAHLTAVTFFAGAMLWSAVALARRQKSIGRTAIDLARLHVAPCVALALVYWFDVRGMIIGGGEGYVLSEVLGRTGALALGSFATQPYVQMAFALLATGIGVVVLVRLYFAGDDAWVFFLTTIFVAPAAILFLRDTPVLYERYFYLSLMFYLPVLGYLLGWLWSLPRSGPWLARAVLVAIVLGNATLTWKFLRVGRGGFYDAVQYMAEHSVEPEIRATTDNPFDCRLYLVYYAGFLPGDRQLALYDDTRELANSPEWIVSCKPGRVFAPLPVVANSQRAAQERYVLVREYPCSDLSGYNCALYQREDLAARQAER